MICIRGLEVRAGSFSLRGIDLEVADGQCAVLMGRTGSGKTTLLEAICGLRAVIAGTIYLKGRDVTHLRPADRGVGYVPQDRALFSTMSVFDNIAFALVVRRWDRHAIRRRVLELAEFMGITHLLDRRPAGLSGGEAQRVALARALAGSPGVLLLDEPLSALDDQTRREMYKLFADVRRHTPVTILDVTHNLAEARHLADRVLVLENGLVRELSGSAYTGRIDPTENCLCEGGQTQASASGPPGQVC